MKTNLTIDQIAELLRKKVWNGKRIYFNNVGYNTKKMRTTTYIYLLGNEIKASAYVDCPSQSDTWCEQRAQEAMDSMLAQLEEVLPAFIAAEEIQAAPAEEVSEIYVDDAGQLQSTEVIVKGYYTEWREVRVPINRFGKLATRNRQFVKFYHGPASNMGYKFVQLSDEAFAFATHNGTTEVMLDAYQEPIDYEVMATHFREREIIAQAEITARLELEKKQASETEQKLKAFNDSLAGMDTMQVLKAWKQAGAPHPAPAVVVEFKNASCLGWKAFTDTL